MWLATFRFLATLRQVRNPMFASVEDDSTKDDSIAAGFVRRSEARFTEFNRAADAFLDAWATAELLFDEATLKAIESVWKEKGTLAGDIARWTAEVDVLGAHSADSHERLFGEDTSKRIDELEAATKAILKGLAIAD